MSMDEIHAKLTCPRCGGPRVVTVVKDVKTEKVKLVMNCPRHFEVSYIMPSALLPQAAPLIRQRILLCRRCGAPVEVQDTRHSGPWTILRIRCSRHGQGVRKISTTLYDTIMQAPEYAGPVTPAAIPPAAAVPEKASPAPEAINFCPQCGTRI